MNQKQALKKLKHGGIKSLLKKAIELGIKASLFSPEDSLLKFEFKGQTVFLKTGEIPVEKRMGNMTRNKNLTKIILGAVGIATPKGIVGTSFSDALRLIKKNGLTYPLIAKPLDGSLAKGVTWDINSKDQLKNAFTTLEKSKYFQKSKKFLVEEMFIGDEFRVLVLNQKVISCVKKIPASLLGDGQSTIKKLIETFNKTRLPGFKLKIDNIAKKTLEKNNLTLSSVLPKDFNLRLRNNLNMSDGGRCIDCTKEMHTTFKKICEQAIDILGLTYGGIDFMAKDISSQKSPYTIIEVNPNPFYNMHEKPLVEGPGVDVSSKILKGLFPKLK